MHAKCLTSFLIHYMFCNGFLLFHSLSCTYKYASRVFIYDSKVFVTILKFSFALLAQISCGGGASSGVFSLATEFLIDGFLTWKWRRQCCAPVWMWASLSGFLFHFNDIKLGVLFLNSICIYLLLLLCQHKLLGAREKKIILRVNY